MVKLIKSRLVTEGKNIGKLYHVTTLLDLVSYVIPNDVLQASGRYTNKTTGTNDIISLTRDPKFVVNTQKIRSSLDVVRITIDGDKLSENYKVFPYNDYYQNGDTIVTREKEECVKGPIKNFSKYIVSIDFLYRDKLKNAILPKEMSKYDYIYKFNYRWTNKLPKDSDVDSSMPKSLRDNLIQSLIFLDMYAKGHNIKVNGLEEFSQLLDRLDNMHRSNVTVRDVADLIHKAYSQDGSLSIYSTASIKPTPLSEVDKSISVEFITNYNTMNITQVNLVITKSSDDSIIIDVTERKVFTNKTKRYSIEIPTDASSDDVEDIIIDALEDEDVM